MTAQANTDKRLVGWLVSYGLDDLGFSYEIRSGRSIISGGGPADNRLLVLSEDTVSEPHLAIKASKKHKVMIQDIFSDHGSFVTRSGSNGETVVNGPVEVQHGDWIRIGDNTRFQVCLLDGPSGR